MLIRIVALAFSLTFLSACTSWRELGYNSTQGFQRNQCQKITDSSERERCLKQTSPTYGDYRKQTEP
jgi:ABC-type Fe3+-hydroxamate transport system substrate-binding protein